jgi:hypothetical protein
MKKYAQQIDYAINTKRQSTYKGDKDYFEWVVAKPEEATGLLKWKIRISKAIQVLKGEADAFTYSKHQ